MTGEKNGYLSIRIPAQDDDGIDFEGLRRQQLFAPAVGVKPEVAAAEHPHAFQAQRHVVGPLRRRQVGSAAVGGERQTIHGLARVELATGYSPITGESRTLRARNLPIGFHVTDLPQLTLEQALAAEDLAAAARGGAIDKVRKGPTTRLFHSIR